MMAFRKFRGTLALAAALLLAPAAVGGPPDLEGIGGDADRNTNVDILFEKKDGTKVKQMAKTSDKKDPITQKYEWEYVLPPGTKLSDFKSILVTSQVKGKKETVDYAPPDFPVNPFTGQQFKLPLITPPGDFPPHILIFTPDVLGLLEFGPTYTLDSMVSVADGLLPGNPYLIIKDASSLPDDIEALFDALAVPGALAALPNYSGPATVEGFHRIPSPSAMVLAAAGTLLAARRRRS